MILIFTFLVLAVYEVQTMQEIQQQTSLLGPETTENPILPDYSMLDVDQVGESDDYTVPESGDNYRNPNQNGNTNTMQHNPRFRAPAPQIPRWPQQTQPLVTTSGHSHSNPLLYNDHVHSSLVNHVRLNLQLGRQFKRYNLKFQDIDSKLNKVSDAIAAITRKIDQLISETKEGFRRSSTTADKKIGRVKADLNQVNSKVEQLRGTTDTNKAQTEHDFYTLQQEILRVEDKANEQSAQLWNTLRSTTHIATNPAGESTNGANGFGVDSVH